MAEQAEQAEPKIKATKALSAQDLAEALRSERAIASAADRLHLAQHALEAAERHHMQLIDHLRIMYGAPKETHLLRVWETGFEEVADG